MPDIACKDGEHQGGDGDEDYEDGDEGVEDAADPEVDMDDPEVKLLSVLTKSRTEISRELSKMNAAIAIQIKQADDVIEAAKDRSVESTHKDAMSVLQKRLTVLKMTVAISCNFSVRQGHLYTAKGREVSHLSAHPIRKSLSFIGANWNTSFEFYLC